MKPVSLFASGASCRPGRKVGTTLLNLVCLTVPGLLWSCGSPAVPIGLNDQTVAVGINLSAPVQQPFSGRWEVQGLPAWLTASPQSGTGNLQTQLLVDRSVAIQTLAAQPTLASEVKVNWTSSDGAQKGSMALKVSAELYALSGRVQDNLSSLNLNATDLHLTGPTWVRASIPAARGVIVGYRSQSARAQAMTTLTSRAEFSGEAVRSAVGRTLVLSTSDVPGTIARLKTDPDVEYVVPDAVLSALELPAQVQSARNQSVQAIGPQQLLTAPLNPSDEFAPLQWAFRLLGYPAVWRDMQQTPYTRPVTVAVLDTGVRYDHPDLKGQLYGPGDGALDLLGYVRNAAGQVVYDNGDGDGPDTDPTDPATPNRSDISHGTHVTGIIVANWGNFAPPCATCSGSGVAGATYSTCEGAAYPSPRRAQWQRQRV